MPVEVLLPEWAVRMQLAETIVDDPGTTAWMRSRPDSIKALMRRLPPSCIVRGRLDLMVPAPGFLGIVVSYREGGTVTVVHHRSEQAKIPTGNVRGECDPDWLEVVGFSAGLNPDDVARILDGQERPHAT